MIVMDYAVGALIGLGVCALVTVAGFERGRAALDVKNKHRRRRSVLRPNTRYDRSWDFCDVAE
jgi:hypothetical protein